MADEKLTKGLGIFDKKQPNCTILLIFVFYLSFMICILFKIVGFDQIWTVVQQKFGTANENLLSSKYPTLFVGSSPKTIIIFYRALSLPVLANYSV
jgi:hypothetical protein